MTITTEVLGLREVQVRLGRVSPEIQTKMRVLVADRLISLRDAVKANIASMLRGGGPLYNAVQTRMEETTSSATGVVFIDGKEIPYADIQERGGDTPPHDIYPKNGKALAFMMKGGGYTTGIGSDWKMRFSGGAMQNAQVVVRHVNHPGSRIPEHPYMRLALYRERPVFEGGIHGIVEGALLLEYRP